MKIAQVCHSFSPYIGGVERYVEEIARRLTDRGWEVVVLTARLVRDMKKREDFNGVKVVRFPSPPHPNPYRFALGLNNYLKSKEYDIVHIHGYHALPAHQVAHFSDIDNLIFTPHYKGFSHSPFRALLLKLFKSFGKKTFQRADKILPVSNYEKKRIRKNFKIKESKLKLIPNGVDLKEFEETKVQNNLGQEKVILCVSRLERYKGVQHLIRALPYLPSRVSLEVVGKGSYKKELLRLAEKLQVKGRIMFYQDLPRRELVKKYVRANLFVLLSKYEAYGRVVAEALAAGTPCIVADATGLSEWIDGESCFGIKYPPPPKQLASLILETIDIENVTNQRVKSWQYVVDALEEVYEEVLSSS